MSACEHDYTYLGLQYRDDGQLRPGSGATTIRYFNTFFCRKCLHKVFERTDETHSSYDRRRPDATPMSRSDWEVGA
jgi:hypothetical protein